MLQTHETSNELTYENHEVHVANSCHQVPEVSTWHQDKWEIQTEWGKKPSSYSARQTIIKIFLRNACVAPPNCRRKISHQAIRKLVDNYWILATAAESGKSSLEQLVQRTVFFFTPFRRDKVSKNCVTGQFPGIESVFTVASLQMYKVQRHGAKIFVSDRWVRSTTCLELHWNVMQCAASGRAGGIKLSEAKDTGVASQDSHHGSYQCVLGSFSTGLLLLQCFCLNPLLFAIGLSTSSSILPIPTLTFCFTSQVVAPCFEPNFWRFVFFSVFSFILWICLSILFMNRLSMADTSFVFFSRRSILREGRRLYFHFEIRPSISVGRLPGLTFAAWELILTCWKTTLLLVKLRTLCLLLGTWVVSPVVRASSLSRLVIYGHFGSKGGKHNSMKNTKFWPFKLKLHRSEVRRWKTEVDSTVSTAKKRQLMKYFVPFQCPNCARWRADNWPAQLPEMSVETPYMSIVHSAMSTSKACHWWHYRFKVP